ncbi:MAG: fumarylacetoacetate hydrolase [Polaromonas sp.]|nr:fumarylacetoacetate hydrolase [Polaromonas sp.]
MKLATYKDASRDGQLVVVSRDLLTAHYATGIANKLQQVLDDWRFMAPQLQDLSTLLNSGKARHAFPFDPARCMAPLPRAYQWASGPAFISHLERLHQVPEGKLPKSCYAAPQLRQGASDSFIGPCDDIAVASEAEGIDFEAQLAVITGDVPLGASAEEGLDSVRLLMLANAVSLRRLMANEAAGGPAGAQCSSPAAFSPVAITPDEVGDAWRQGRLNLTLQTTWNGRKVGLCEAGAGMTFHFGQLVAHLCRHRSLGAGSIVGSGAVSNPDWQRGYNCIAEKRAVETLDNGKPVTGFMKFGDTLRIEVKDKNGQSVFGAMDQKIMPAQAGDMLLNTKQAALPGSGKIIEKPVDAMA